MAQQNPNWPLSCWQACFTVGANAATPTVWDDLTQRVDQWTSGMGKQQELDDVESGSADLHVRNIDEALSPGNPTSPYNTGGKALKSYRQIRHWAAVPLAGNFLNAGNDQWVTPYVASTLADTASNEGATTGTWLPVGGCTIASSTTQAHSGTRSLAVTWATTIGGSGVADVGAWSVPLKAGTVYTLSAWIYLGAGAGQVAVACQGFSATSTTTTGVWQRVVLSFTATAGTADTRIHVYATAATTAGQTVWVDDVQLEAAASASTWTATGPVIYPTHTGFIEQYPLTWDPEYGGMEGWAALTSVDALAVMSRLTLDDVITADVLQDTPTYHWALDDQAGVVAAQYGTGVVGQLLPMTLTPVGIPPRPTRTFGGSSSPGPDGGTSLTFAPVTVSATYAAVADWLGITGTYLGGNTTGYTLEFWFTATAAASAANQMRLARIWGASEEELGVVLLTTGRIQVIHQGVGGATDTSATSPGVYADGCWHHVAVVATAAGAAITEALWVDGTQVATQVRSGTVTMPANGLMLGVDFWAGTYAFTGSMSHVAVYTGALAAARIQSHWLGGRTGFAGDTTGQRVTRILGWARWKGPTVLPAGMSRHGPVSGLKGTAALDAIKTAVASTENGAFVAHQSGVATFIPRSAYYTQTAATRTFGESFPTETPYLAGAAEQVPDLIYNTIKVTRGSGGSSATASANAQIVISTSSVGDYGTRTLDITSSHVSDADAVSMGVWIGLNYQDGHLRVPEVKIQPSHNPALWTPALAARFGDRVTWKRRTSAGWTIALDGYITRIEHAVDAADPTSMSWTVTFQIQPVPIVQVGIVGDATYGVTGTTLITAY